MAELTPTVDADLVAQLNDAASHKRSAWPVAAVVAFVGLLTLPYGIMLWLLGLPICWWLAQRDTARRSVVLFYDVADQPAQSFHGLLAAWTSLAACDKRWRVVQSGAVNTVRQHKTNAGASSLVARLPVAAVVQPTAPLRTNVDVPTLTAGKVSLCLLPDRLLVRDGRTFSDHHYSTLEIEAGSTNFIEQPGQVPSDATAVGQTWQYVNVKGGPDGRYKSNPLLPIVRYGTLRIAGATGLRWDIQTSTVESAVQAAAALRQLQEAVRSAAQTQMQAPTVLPGTTTSPPVAQLPAPAPFVTPATPPATTVRPKPLAPPAGDSPSLPPGEPIRVSGRGRQSVVGEQYHPGGITAAIASRVAPQAGDWDNALPVVAYLVPEPKNPHDGNAIRVDVDTPTGRATVGYLPREAALRYGADCRTLAARNRYAQIDGRIVAGHNHIQVYLHLGQAGELIFANDPPASAYFVDPARECALIDEKNHQAALTPFAPTGPNQRTSVWCTLSPGVVPSGKYAGEPTVDVLIQGAVVGALSAPQAARSLDLRELLDQGLVVACQGAVFRKSRGGLEASVFLSLLTDEAIRRLSRARGKNDRQHELNRVD
ncbi:MAG: hypothetical protein M9891_13635 [Austwickia sp.]|nr:hypothetical protein [Actinomycetota bacterium]MCO5310298.1 hypothetical protein [Austwickia sp.]